LTAAKQFTAYWGFITALVALAGGVGTVWLFGKAWLREIVRAEVQFQSEPAIKMQEAHLRLERNEEDAFRVFDEALALIKQRQIAGASDEYGNALRHFLFHLAISTKPELHQAHLEAVIEKFRAAGITMNLGDRMSVAQFRFNIGKANDVRQEFEQIARMAGADHEPFVEAAAWEGAMFCCLASGNAEEALRFFQLAQGKNPVYYREWTLEEHDPFVIRSGILYDQFNDTVRRFNEQFRKDATVRKP